MKSYLLGYVDGKDNKPQEEEREVPNAFDDFGNPIRLGLSDTASPSELKDKDNPWENCMVEGPLSTSPKSVPEKLIYDWDEIGSHMLKETVEKLNEVIQYLESWRKG